MLKKYMLDKIVETCTLGNTIKTDDDISEKNKYALDNIAKNPNVENTLAKKIADVENNVANLENIASKIVILPDGTSANAQEIEDAKNGPNGEVYDTLQDAIARQIDSYKGVLVSSLEPSNDSNSNLWFNTSDNDNIFSVPEINDNTNSLSDTWSSAKITREITKCILGGIELPDNGNGEIDYIPVDIATNISNGIVSPDGLTIVINNGVISTADGVPATTDSVGLVKPDNDTIVINNGKISLGRVVVADNDTPGIVKPDGTSIVIDADGKIHARIVGEIYVDDVTYIANKTLRDKFNDIDKDITDLEESLNITNYNKAVVPRLASNLVYNGVKQTPTWYGLDEEMVSIEGETSGINAGTYRITVKPKSPYKWKDGTNTSIKLTWTIERQPITISTSTNVVELDDSKLYETISINKTIGGKLIVTSTDSNIASPSLNGNVLTITGDVNYAGNAIIIVRCEGTSNYAPSNDLYITVHADYVDIVDWASGTDEEIAAMLDAHYKGLINVNDYWAVGDSRTVQLNRINAANDCEAQPAQEIELVIVDGEFDELNESIDGTRKAAITVQTKGPLVTLGKINSEASYVSTDSDWKNSKRREWLNNNFYNALPEGIKSLIKTVNKSTYRYTDNSYSSYRGLTVTADKCFLPSEREVWGEVASSYYGTSIEPGDEYGYFKISGSHKIKKIYNQPYGWWMRTSLINETGDMYFLATDENNNHTRVSGVYEYGIVPTFCL